MEMIGMWYRERRRMSFDQGREGKTVGYDVIGHERCVLGFA